MVVQSPISETLLVDISTYREDFPILQTTMNGKPLVFLDSAASAQKPRSVIDIMAEIHEEAYSNIHRGLYEISQNLTARYEAVRLKVSRFIGAPSEKNIVFTGNATEAINLVAQSWGRKFLKPGDVVLLSEMEHHANIVPWQLLRDEIGIEIETIPFDAEGVLDVQALEKCLTPKVKVLGVTHVSNVFGTVNPIREIIGLVRVVNPEIKVLVDGSQGVMHALVDVVDMDADFYAFTGHKLYGPTGVGVLYGKSELLDIMPPWKGGGDMIEHVSFEHTTYKEAPFKFEAGTPPIVQVIGLGEAIDYLRDIGMLEIAAHEAALVAYATPRLKEIEGLSIHGNAPYKAGLISFTMEQAHTSDIGMVLDQCGIAVRSGHHCCMPLMEALGVDSTVRASFGLYSNRDDVDALIAGLHKVKTLFG